MAVSLRRAALERAGRAVRLKVGYVEAEGALVDLPGTCEATRLLWCATDDRDSR